MQSKLISSFSYLEVRILLDLHKSKFHTKTHSANTFVASAYTTIKSSSTI